MEVYLMPRKEFGGLCFEEDSFTLPRSLGDSFIRHEHNTIEGTSPAPPHLENDVAFAAKKLVEINLGNLSHPHPTFLGTRLDVVKKQVIFYLLCSYCDCFVWSYDEMFGLSPSVVLHHLVVKPHVCPVQ